MKKIYSVLLSATLLSCAMSAFAARDTIIPLPGGIADPKGKLTIPLADLPVGVEYTAHCLILPDAETIVNFSTAGDFIIPIPNVVIDGKTVGSVSGTNAKFNKGSGSFDLTSFKTISKNKSLVITNLDDKASVYIPGCLAKPAVN